MLNFNANKWFFISIFNFLIVAVIGVIMRYKIGFDFPYFDQKNLQHGHSHFAFSGWISQTIMLLMVGIITPHIVNSKIRVYNWILGLNLFTAYGMLLAFLANGYNTISIIFSTASIIISFVFAFYYFKDLSGLKSFAPKRWFITSLLMLILSAFGTAVLVYIMVIKDIHQIAYLSSIYWYLHFQYNGWFFFACMGILIHHFQKKLGLPKIPESVFWYFALSCIPAYGLSVLWRDLPILIYGLVVVAAVGQFYAWVVLLFYCRQNKVLTKLGNNLITKLLFAFIAAALTVKFTLQLGSVIPTVSTLAFGFRSIVIAYLHLVLIGIISMFILTYAYSTKLLLVNKISSIGIMLFLVSVIIYELALATQGIASFSYTVIPGIDYILVSFTVLICLAIAILFISQIKSSGLRKI